MSRSRSISDEEIALIKAMIERDMANKDIQFFLIGPIDRSTQVEFRGYEMEPIVIQMRLMPRPIRNWMGF